MNIKSVDLVVRPVEKLGAVILHAGFDEQRQETYYEQD